jgi:exosortase/archaeosortase family protein
MEPVEQFLMNQVYLHSLWINQHIFKLEVIPLGDVLFFTNHTHITINIGCSGFKQMLHLGILFMVYPGPWRKKLWFIPLGIVIMHLINLFRLVGLSLILQSNPEYFAQAHDNFFRPLFYILIFGMWIWWTEKLTKKEIR